VKNTFCEINANDAKLLDHGTRSSGAMVSLRFSTIVALYSRSVEGRVHFMRAQVNPRIATRQEGRATLNAEQIYEEFAVVGTPDQCVAKLQHFQQICGPQEVMGWFNTGGRLPHHQVERSMRLFAQEVMSHFLISVLH